ncbi:PAS domain-containing protein [Candidatus Thorarchaeota archaeon]|nr:MAG: PAS domain-containing protein [Candidatus Thorarchaeota archaeon]
MKWSLESESFVQKILNLSNEPLLIINGDTIDTCNNAAERFLEVPRDELVGKRILDVIDLEIKHDQGGASFLSNLARSKDNVLAARMIRYKGTSTPYDIECSVVSLNANNGFIIKLRGGMRDYQESKSDYETVIYDSLVPSFRLSKRGIIQDINASAVELLGYKRDDLLKRHFDPLIKRSGGNENSITSQLIRELLQGKKIQDIEVELVNSDNESVWVSLTALYFDLEQKPVIDILAVDITARKTAEESRNIAQEQVALWTEVMTHDLNNVNQSILFSIGYVLETVKLPQDAKTKLLEANWEIRRGARMISNLRKLNQLRDHPPKREAVNLASCIRNVVSHIEDQIVHKDIEITLEGSIDGVEVFANENLEDVFFNVLENAIVHDPSTATNIRVEVNEKTFKDRVRIEIEDQGPGIPDSLKRIIFNRTQSLGGRNGGRGLGLTLVRTIIHSIGGEIWVEDRVEGKPSLGTRIAIELDLWKEDETLECGRDSCIAFYMSDHCLFCGPSLDILVGVLELFDISSSAIEIINIDDPSVHLDRKALPMLPVTRICDREIAGLTDATRIRQAVTEMMIRGCARFSRVASHC